MLMTDIASERLKSSAKDLSLFSLVNKMHAPMRNYPRPWSSKPTIEFRSQKSRL